MRFLGASGSLSGLGLCPGSCGTWGLPMESSGFGIFPVAGQASVATCALRFY